MLCFKFLQQAATGSIPGMPPGMPPPGGPAGLPPGLAGLPGGLPPTSAAGLLSLAGHPSAAGIPVSTASMMGGLHALQQQQAAVAAHQAAAAAAAAAQAAGHQQRPPLPSSAGPSGGPGQEQRDEKPGVSGEEQRLKHSASASPHGAPIPPAPRPHSSASAGPRSPRASTPNEESLAKRIKTEDNVRKSGHVSLKTLFDLLFV